MNRYKRHLAGFRPVSIKPASSLTLKTNRLGEFIIKKGNKRVVAGPFVCLNEAHATLIAKLLLSKKDFDEL